MRRPSFKPAWDAHRQTSVTTAADATRTASDARRRVDPSPVEANTTARQRAAVRRTLEAERLGGSLTGQSQHTGEADR